MISVNHPQVFSPFGKPLTEHVGPADALDPTGSSESLGDPRNTFHDGKILEKKAEYYGGGCWKLLPASEMTFGKYTVKGCKDKGLELPLEDCEIELYWKKNFLTISQGNGSHKELVRTQTEKDTILDVFVVTFSDPILPLREKQTTLESCDSLKCLCVLMPTQVAFYAADGMRYSVSLPFVARKAWPVEFGVMIERRILSRELLKEGAELLPTVFSVVHPHGEIVPVAVQSKESGYKKFVQDRDMRLVTCLNSLPLAVFYNASARTHCVCWIRAIADEELIVDEDLGDSFLDKTRVDSMRQRTVASVHDADLTGYSLRRVAQDDPDMEPRIEMSSFLRDPVVGKLDDAEEICPDLLLVKIWEESDVRPCGATTREQIWDRKLCRKATKAFVSTDFSSTTWLGLVLPNALGEVRMIELKRQSVRNSYECPFQCGVVREIKALNACPVEDLSLVVLSLENGDVVAYSGTTKIERLMINGQIPLMQYERSLEVRALNADEEIFRDTEEIVEPRSRYYKGCDTLAKLKDACVRNAGETTMESSSNDAETVEPFPWEVGVVIRPTVDCDGQEWDWVDPGDLITSVHRYLIIRTRKEKEKFVFLRVKLPPMFGYEVVGRCLSALKYVLRCSSPCLFPTLAHRWYCTRNSPGNSEHSPTELSKFLDCLLSLLGFPCIETPEAETGLLRTDREGRKTSRGKHYESVSRMEESSKRACLVDDDEEVDAKLVIPVLPSGSLTMQLFELAKEKYPELADCLNTGTLKQDETPAVSALPVQRKSLNETAPLNGALELVFLGIHLVYEEVKLSSFVCPAQWSMTRFLVTVCYRLPSSLRHSYFNYYWRECPSLVADVVSRAAAAGLRVPQSAIDAKYLADHEPLCLIRCLMDLATRNGVVRRGWKEGFPVLPGVTKDTEIVVEAYSALFNRQPSAGVDLLRSGVLLNPTGSKCSTAEGSRKKISFSSGLDFQACLAVLLKYRVNEDFVKRLPSGVVLPLLHALHASASCPPEFLTSSEDKVTAGSLLCLMGRDDLAYMRSDEMWSDAVGLESMPERNGRKPDFDKLMKCAEAAKTVFGPTKDKKDVDGMEDLDWDLFKLRFQHDQRTTEVRKYLDSSKPVSIRLSKRPDQNDLEFMEAQEKQLLHFCNRTMTLPIGRGLFTLRIANRVAFEPEVVPKLCLTGKAVPRSTTVELSRLEVPADMALWPSFHNGVASGLRIRSGDKSMCSSWVVFNKPQIAPGATPAVVANTVAQHGGFLLAMGLNGHLKHLASLNAHDYLRQCKELVTVGMLLGMGADFCGTQNLNVLKLITLHMEAMTVPTPVDLDIAMPVQTAAAISLGLLYMGSGDGHISRVLLEEIGRPPGPEMDDSKDRESYCLSAGLALGMVCLGRGEEILGEGAKRPCFDSKTPRTLADTLYHYITGGTKRPFAGVQKDKYKTPSYQIKEGERINLDMTAPGATLAFGLMFFNTGSRTVTDWLSLPATAYGLDCVRPDLIMLRVISRGLILWSKIQPKDDWVKDQIPSYIPKCIPKVLGVLSGESSTGLRLSLTDRSVLGDEEDDTEFGETQDLELMSQAYCNVVAGSCLVMAMRFAGSGDKTAFEVIYRYAKAFLKLVGRQNPALRLQSDFIHRATVMNCVGVLTLSLGVLMAGTGDLKSLKVCRAIHFKTGLLQSEMAYGLNMAAHMAMGLLFLGGSGFSLQTSPKAVAAMVISLFPKFPAHSADNRYHLQALRHLIVMAAEPRHLVPFLVPSVHVEDDSGMPVSAKLFVVCRPDGHLVGSDKSQGIVQLPGLLPELDTVESIKLVGKRFWSYGFERGKPSWDLLMDIMRKRSGYTPVQARQGAETYEIDPSGFRSRKAALLTSSHGVTWTYQSCDVSAFLGLPGIAEIPEFILGSASPEDADAKERAEHDRITTLFFEYVTQGRIIAFGDALMLSNIARSLKDGCSKKDFGSQLTVCTRLRQMSLAIAFMQQVLPDSKRTKQLVEDFEDDADVVQDVPLVTDAAGTALRSLASDSVDGWRKELLPYLRSYFGWESKASTTGVTMEMSTEISPDFSMKLAMFLEFYRLPFVPPSSMKGEPSAWEWPEWRRTGVMEKMNIGVALDLYNEAILCSESTK